MGSNNKQPQQSSGGYGSSNADPRGRQQNMQGYQQQRFENQQGPLTNMAAYNYGRGSESNYGDYTDIMNSYRSIASGEGGQGSEGGGGGGGGASDGGFNAMGMYTPFTVNYSDPFKSYAGFEEFSNTGGYSRDDIANMRARGISPIRAAYGNAEREMGRQRSLQGGYSPNAFASLGRMAREQGQAAADATQGVEAGLAEARNKGRLAGLGGMSGIEGQRLDAQLKAGMFNAEAQERAQSRNIAAGESAAGRSSAASIANAGAANDANQANMKNRFAALEGMTNLYGTTPGMAQTFGNQALQGTGQGMQMGLGQINAGNNVQKLPGQWDTGMSRFNQGMNMAGQIGNVWLNR